jgi:hypothetical protein
VAASNLAFQAIAGIASAICLAAAMVAWLTQPSWQHGKGGEVATTAV